ncbi:hypothetical protein BKH42_01725 [Helicobacter sp. 13S00482-2]|uniref:hypothetical protein n=1 Tax=Helicobacter sp. 13S00482-2 TaxID=1476200 RepID=UPI000BA50970|nr:hypothetical protein [Helicobacter sp. 13S00482-2]PAF54250.1 hypothetical protein BKH42_01725 [Helicobacter sp. 13S00482-2]
MKKTALSKIDILEQVTINSKPSTDVLLELPKIIEECENALQSKNVELAQELKTRIFLNYEKYYYRAMKENLGKDFICEYDIYGQYSPEMLNIHRSYRLNHSKLFENLSILKTKLLSLKKVFDKKPSIFV